MTEDMRLECLKLACGIHAGQPIASEAVIGTAMRFVSFISNDVGMQKGASAGTINQALRGIGQGQGLGSTQALPSGAA